jgi:hypothetical protein
VVGQSIDRRFRLNLVVKNISSPQEACTETDLKYQRSPSGELHSRLLSCWPQDEVVAEGQRRTACRNRARPGGSKIDIHQQVQIGQVSHQFL